MPLEKRENLKVTVLKGRPIVPDLARDIENTIENLSAYYAPSYNEVGMTLAPMRQYIDTACCR